MSLSILLSEFLGEGGDFSFKLVYSSLAFCLFSSAPMEEVELTLDLIFELLD
jgi:hypothetical protein